MKVAVLGAGVIGITTAYFLAEEGYEVVVIDRQSESAQECSFSNGGQCSFSHVRPWAHPSILPHLFPWLFGDDTPLVFRRFLGWREWRWAASFVRHCTHGHSLTTTENVWRLAHYSKQVLAGIREKEQIEFSHQSKGTLHIFSTQKELDQELKQAEYQRMLGCPYKALDYMGCIRKEPSLQYANQPIVGGVFFPLDETGNVFLFTQALARLCKEKGVTFLYEHAIERFEKSGET